MTPHDQDIALSLILAEDIEREYREALDEYLREKLALEAEDEERVRFQNADTWPAPPEES